MLFVAILYLAASTAASDASNGVIPCEDDWLDCKERASLGSCVKTNHVHESIRTLSYCRLSCREHINKMEKTGKMTKQMKALLDRLGGTGDVLESSLGTKIPICNVEKGWTAEARKNYIEMRNMGISYFTGLHTTGPRKYSKDGFERDRVPPTLWKKILEVYNSIKDYPDENLRRPGIYNGSVISDDGYECTVNKDFSNSGYTFMGKKLEDQIRDTLQPLAERWAGGVELTFDNAYGIRRYKPGAWLAAHTDVTATKVVSAIINVGQDVGEHPWPLDILDHSGEAHKVYLEPGDLVWYESARVIHGREEYFLGKHFDNIFVHFYPARK